VKSIFFVVDNINITNIRMATNWLYNINFFRNSVATNVAGQLVVLAKNDDIFLSSIVRRWKQARSVPHIFFGIEPISNSHLRTERFFRIYYL
jgi:hypothetical protein